MTTLYTGWILLIGFIGICVSPPVPKHKTNDDVEHAFKTEGLPQDQAQDQEYFRYLTQVIQELEKDPSFKEVLSNSSEDDIKSGKVADSIDFVAYNVRAKLDEVKRIEIEYQRELLRQKKDHMAGIDRNYWNPIHHDNKDTFEKDDLKQLLFKHNDMMAERDTTRHQDFKKYELEKEHKRREAMKNMTEEDREKERTRKEAARHKKHEKIHEPGHKAQVEEVWEKEDGLDPEDFNPKTFFNLHDKNSDGYLDQFELETLFLQDLDKVYNESDPETDKYERQEEMERMREHVLKSMDKDKDGLLSLEEFILETKNDDFEEDEEWKPIVEQDQYTDDELNEYEHALEKEEHESGEDHQTNETKEDPKTTDPEPERGENPTHEVSKQETNELTQNQDDKHETRQDDVSDIESKNESVVS